MPTGMAIVISVAMFGYAAVALVTGRMKYSSNVYVTRAERPKAYWTMVGLSALLGVAALVLLAVQRGRAH